MADTANPAHIMQIGLGFWASKTLLSAVELDLFTVLAQGPRTRAELQAKLGLDRRGTADFLDALVALKLLAREGEDQQARYANTPDTAAFLDRGSPAFLGGLLRMANDRLYGFWGGLTEALRTGQPQNEIKTTGGSAFEAIYADPARLEQFLRAMAGISAGPCMALAQRFDFAPFQTLTDAGGATGLLSICVARQHAHMRATTVDLPPVEPIARQTIARAELSDRVQAASADFFSDPLPEADVVTMGHILHDWGLEEKQHLVRAAFQALPKGGAFVAIDNIIDDARRENAFGLLMSLNMLVETPAGFDYTGADFARWCRSVGFSSVEVVPLVGPTSAAIARK